MAASAQDLEDQRASRQDLQQRVRSMQAEQGSDSCSVLQHVNQMQVRQRQNHLKVVLITSCCCCLLNLLVELVRANQMICKCT